MNKRPSVGTKVFHKSLGAGTVHKAPKKLSENYTLVDFGGILGVCQVHTRLIEESV